MQALSHKYAPNKRAFCSWSINLKCTHTIYNTGSIVYLSFLIQRLSPLWYNLSSPYMLTFVELCAVFSAASWCFLSKFGIPCNYAHMAFWADKNISDLISYCWYNPQPMRNDHSIAGTTILQTTPEDADSTQFYWWLDKSGGKGSSLDFKTFRCSTPSSVGSHERKSRFTFPTLPFMATDWRWCWTPKRLEVQTTTFTTGFV